MPGLNIKITRDDLLEYKKLYKYCDVSLKDWLTNKYKIPSFQPITSIQIEKVDLSGMDLSFIDFAGIKIADCIISQSTIFAGASLRDADIINTPIGHAQDLGYSLIVGVKIDGTSAESVNNQEITDQSEALVKAIQHLESHILKSDDELEVSIRKVQDAFEANLIATLLEKRTGQNVTISRNIDDILKHRITKFMPDSPSSIKEALFEQIKATNLRLYPEDLDAIKTMCDNISKKVTRHSTESDISRIVTEEIPRLVAKWENETESKHEDFHSRLEIIAHSKIIREREVRIQETKRKSVLERGWTAFTTTALHIKDGLKKPLTGALIGGAAGLAQGSGLTDKVMKAVGGAAVGAAALQNIPVSVSPFAPSDWPTIDPKDTSARSADLQLKLRGLFWCSMIAGGAIEGVTGETFGISTMSTVVSSFSLIKEFFPNSSNPTDPEQVNAFIAQATQKFDSALSQYSKILDSQLGDRLLEVGAIMKELEPRVGIILANRKVIQLTQSATPGFLGDMLTTGESIQNFISFWALRNNYYSITKVFTEEKEKDFMDRRRPGSEALNKEIDSKIWLKKVTLRSIMTVGLLSVGITLGLPLFGAAAGIVGIPAAVIGASALLAVTSIGYIGKNFFNTTSLRTTAKWLSPKAPEHSVPKPHEHKHQHHAKKPQHDPVPTTAAPSKPEPASASASKDGHTPGHFAEKHTRRATTGFVDREQNRTKGGTGRNIP